jgi:phage N-6-adenine-methyltransferase
LTVSVGRPRLYPDIRTTWREGKRRQRQRQQADLKVYHRSTTVEWSTPQDLFDRLNAEFGFTLDVCATAENAKCARYFTKEDNGMDQPWEGVCWMNPPYGRNIIGPWVAKAYESAQAGATVVCLLPVRTDTQWWQRYCIPHAHVDFLKGRVKFGSARHGATFPSAVVIFRPPSTS